MGRGERGAVANSVSRGESAPQEEGEIAFLDADNIDDYSGRAAMEENTSFGAPDDDKAIRNLIVQLKRRPKLAGLSDEQIEDQAINLYNGICAKIATGQASDQELERAGQLFGEDPDRLLDRLS